MANSSHSRRFGRLRVSDAQMWANFDAQPQHVKEWFWDFPLAIWPGTSAPVSNSALDQSYDKYLADLSAVWGPDHPAVIDAQSRVATRRGKVVKLLTSDDLSDLF